MQNILVVTL